MTTFDRTPPKRLAMGVAAEWSTPGVPYLCVRVMAGVDGVPARGKRREAPARPPRVEVSSGPSSFGYDAKTPLGLFELGRALCALAVEMNAADAEGEPIGDAGTQLPLWGES